MVISYIYSTCWCMKSTFYERQQSQVGRESGLARSGGGPKLRTPGATGVVTANVGKTDQIRKNQPGARSFTIAQEKSGKEVGLRLRS
jgi:hypothetical protein